MNKDELNAELKFDGGLVLNQDLISFLSKQCHI